MKRHFLFGVVACLLAGCSPTSQQDDREGQIDILPAFDQPTELKISQLGKHIRYVPLETNDTALVGNSYTIQLLEDKILVATGRDCLLFDKQTGKFLRKVGMFGQGPKDYSSPHCHVQEHTGLLAFRKARGGDKMVRYDQEGNYVDVVNYAKGLTHYPLFSKQGIIGYCGSSFGKHKSNEVAFFNENMEKTDSIIRYTVPGLLDTKDIARISVMQASKAALETAGLLGQQGIIYIEKKNGSRSIVPAECSSLWQYKDKVRFWEPYCDTIYTIKDKTLVPYLIFNTGERHFPVERQGDGNGTTDFLTMTYVMETPQVVFFQFAKGFYSKSSESSMFDGIYDKQSGKVTINKRQPLTDDLTGFMPLTLHTHTTQGEFAAVLETPDIMEWLEEHPDTKLEGSLAPLKNLTDDDNPVVVIIE